MELITYIVLTGIGLIILVEAFVSGVVGVLARLFTDDTPPWVEQLAELLEK
jgi:hypothetical protein